VAISEVWVARLEVMGIAKLKGWVAITLAKSEG
jgi:hypothetical protein